MSDFSEGFVLGSLLLICLEFCHYFFKERVPPLDLKPWEPSTPLCGRVGHDFRDWSLSSSSICHRCGKRVEEC